MEAQPSAHGEPVGKAASEASGQRHHRILVRSAFFMVGSIVVYLCSNRLTSASLGTSLRAYTWGRAIRPRACEVVSFIHRHFARVF